MNKSFRFIIPTNKRDCDYVGLELNETAPQFVFPCRYLESDADEKLCRYEAKKLLSIIKKIQSEYFFGGNTGDANKFYSMTWLVRDYMEKGYYTETDRIAKKSFTGRIDWKRTVSKSSFFYHDGNIIYKDFYRSKNIINTGNIISHVYKFCLAYSVSLVGFVYGVASTEKSVFSEHDINYMCYVVKKELSTTFNSYKKLLLNHMLSILTGMRGNSQSADLSLKDFEFEYVFEHLVNCIFGTENVRDYYSQSSYVLLDGSGHGASKLRPDTIMNNAEGNPNYFVIDSKYYNYGYTGNPRDLPQSSSITKQIGYNYYLENKFDPNTFYSVFLLPFAKPKEEEEIIKYVGYAKNECSDHIKSENKVAVCLIDLKSLIDTYFGTGIISKDGFKYLLAESVSKCFGNNDDPSSI